MGPFTLRARTSLATIVVVAVAGCASPARLARQSDEALAHGDLSKAYDRALRAVEKDPQNAAARQAYDAASQRVAADYRRRVIAAAASDTIAAADLALRFRDFRAEVGRHGSPLPSAPDYEEAEPRLLEAAARSHYRAGREQMTAHHPRSAYGEFDASLRYVPAYRDAEHRRDLAMVQAIVRVAVLPFSDGVGVRGLSEQVLQDVTTEIAGRIGSEYRFTRLVPLDTVMAHVSIAQMRELSREDALAIGRAVGAGLVVTGRISGLHSTDRVREPSILIVHREESKDDQGKTVVTWRPSTLDFVIRDRDVDVRWSFDVLDVRSGLVALHRDQDVRAAARIAWTNYRPEEDADHYAFFSPEDRSAHPDRVRETDARWKEALGSWTLPEFLRAARNQRDRSRYASRYRREFRGDTHAHPVWMGELPDESELTFVALGDAWRPVHDVLRQLDRTD